MSGIFLTGRDRGGWALDTDYELAKKALSPVAPLSRSVFGCNYIHSVWPNNTYQKYYSRKGHFISVFQADPLRLFEDKGFYDFCKDGLCVAQTNDAYKKLKSLGVDRIVLIPYIADTTHFFFIKNKSGLRKKFGIGRDAFVISNFMRDSEGADLYTPKLVKGPDIFVEIVEKICCRIGYDRVEILLAGPRRHWIRKALLERNIRFKFIGQITKDDDYAGKMNILSSEIINELYNASDLTIISSRSEGGPRAILEAACAGVPILSTNVGIAPDVLKGHSIYTEPDEAVEIAIRHFKENILNNEIVHNYDVVHNYHSVKAVSEKWQEFYLSDEVVKRRSKRKIYASDFKFSTIRDFFGGGRLL